MSRPPANQVQDIVHLGATYYREGCRSILGRVLEALMALSSENWSGDGSLYQRCTDWGRTSRLEGYEMADTVVGNKTPSTNRLRSVASTHGRPCQYPGKPSASMFHILIKYVVEHTMVLRFCILHRKHGVLLGNTPSVSLRLAMLGRKVAVMPWCLLIFVCLSSPPLYILHQLLLRRDGAIHHW
jgi:hypothetical protein